MYVISSPVIKNSIKQNYGAGYKNITKPIIAQGKKIYYSLWWNNLKISKRSVGQYNSNV